jgi:hypothetical protein
MEGSKIAMEGFSAPPPPRTRKLDIRHAHDLLATYHTKPHRQYGCLPWFLGLDYSSTPPLHVLLIIMSCIFCQKDETASAFPVSKIMNVLTHVWYFRARPS